MKTKWFQWAMIFGCILNYAGCSSKDNKSTGNDEPQDTTAVHRPAYIGNAPVRLNEVVPVNINFDDHNGDDPAWLELYNPADSAVNLAGYSLTDDIALPRQWVFGNVVVPAKAYQIVFLSGKNILEPVPAQDSISLINNNVYDWNDSYRTDIPGNSSSLPFEYPTIAVSDSTGHMVISAALTLGDNMSLPDESLHWASSQVGINLTGAPVDLSATSMLIIRGYIQSGRELTVRLVQSGMDAWLCWSQVLRGNGEANATYRIALPQGTNFPNLKDIRQILLEATGPYLSTVRFTIRDIYAEDVPVYLHTNFKVGKKGQTLYLLDSNAIRDSLSYPDMPTNTAWGYDQQGGLGFLSIPSPGGASSVVAMAERQVEAKPVTAAGFYAMPVSVELTVPEGSTVHYTIDGSIPTIASPIYRGPITIAKTTVVRSFAQREGSLDGPISTATYFIADSSSLPVVSLSTDPNGLFNLDTGIFVGGNNPGSAEPYYGSNFWAPKELPVSVEFFDEKGARQWAQDAGLSIFGNYSRQNNKKAVSIKFRERYGKSKLTYPLFPMHPDMTEFRTLALRANGGNISSDYIRDALAQDLAEGLDVDYQRNRPVIVYYNGEYFGIYHLLQKMDSKYPESAFGISEENVEFVEPSKSTLTQSYQSMMDHIVAMDGNAALANAQFADSLLDMNEMMNYTALQFYVANTDWPANNIRIWKGTNPTTRWRSMLFDVDFGFGSSNNSNPVDFDMFTYMVTPTVYESGDTAVWPNGPTSTIFYRKILLENTVYHPIFINRILMLLNYQFSASRVNAMIDSLMANIQKEIPRDQVRWSRDPVYMEQQLATIHSWAANRPAAMRKQIQSLFGYGPELNATISYSGRGSILMDGQPMPVASMNGPWLKGQSYTLKALPMRGASFAGWSDGVTTAERIWAPKEGEAISALFR